MFKRLLGTVSVLNEHTVRKRINKSRQTRHNVTTGAINKIFYVRTLSIGVSEFLQWNIKITETTRASINCACFAKAKRARQYPKAYGRPHIL